MKLLTLLLTVTAFGQLTERDLKFVKQPPMTGVIDIPRSYALVVGISDYANLPTRGQLDYSARDAVAMYTSLISPKGGQFAPENVHRLIGKQATLANLRRELEEWLPGVSREGDRVLIYFAGDSFVSGGQAYLAPYDIDLANIPGSSYPMKTLGHVLGGEIKAKWKILLTDAGHSPALTPEADGSQINLIRIDQRLFSLTASRDRELSFGREHWGGGHGVFTYYVIKAIEGEADDNRDGVVTADELAEYVRVNVRRDTVGKQNPTAERGGFDPQMILAYNASRTAIPTPAPKLGGLVIATNMDGVEIFVDGKSAGTINKEQPLRLPGLLPGVHTVKAVHMGYEPDGPREETVYPGQETTVSSRISIARFRTKAALDAFDDGLELYQKGFEKNYRAAATAFEKALSIDAKFSQAALYLGRTYNALFDGDKAKAAFRQAIEIDPDYAEARTSYGGMLLDLGDLDESIRQLEGSMVKEPGSSLTNSLLAQASIRNGALQEAERFARESIRLNAGHAEAHFWLAESLRFSKQCPESRREYAEYLRLSYFDPKLAGKLNYYFVPGYLAGIGKKDRATQTDIWRELRFLANFGACDCARMSNDYDAAIRSCQQALSFNNGDLFAHYALGLTYIAKYNTQGSVVSLDEAKTHLETVIRLNPNAQEAEKAKIYVANMNKMPTGTFLEQELVISRETGDRRREGNLLDSLGATYFEMNQFERAIGYYNQSLTIARELEDRARELKTIDSLGAAYRGLGKYQQSSELYEQALAFRQGAGDRRGTGVTLNDLATVNGILGRYSKATSYLEQALAISRELKDAIGEVISIADMAGLYLDLGENHRAISYSEQALTMATALKRRDLEARALSSLGSAFLNLGQPEPAVHYFDRTFSAYQNTNNHLGRSMSVINLGEANLSLGNGEKAAQYCEDALTYARDIANRSRESMALACLGKIHTYLNCYDTAIGYYGKSLAIARETQMRKLQADDLARLMLVWKYSDKPRLSIFYGKNAINVIQSVRSDNRSLSGELQQSFLKSNEKTYHSLAELLIAQGRLSEAEQVLGLLKEQEFFDYIRRDTAEAATLNRRVGLTAEEAEWEKRYAAVGDRLVTIGTERGELRAKKSLTPEETARLTQLEQDLALGNQAFEKFLGELTTNFSAKPALANRVEELRETQGIMEDLRELPAGTVAIYTLMGEEKLSVILRTPDTVKAYSFPIKSTDLNRKILEFRQVIQNPKLDPRPLAQELYKILIGPMAGDLRQAKTQTLMWSLDGALRYIPLAALYDGKQYLVEQYRLSVMTLASNSRLKDQPSAQWQAAGFGVTKAWAGSSALPSVAGELSGIITTKSGDGGVLAGEIQLDDKFTQVSMRDALRKKPTVVHIASHFQFQAGDQTNSFLLLGDGGRLSMAELRTSASLFGGVQLLTLSACNTGVGDGAEVEGFGALAQRQGAKAVIASLWPVADASTSFLMREFYRIRESTPGLSKAAAMARAQLELLRGTAQPAPGPERAMVHEAGTVPVTAPSFPVNPDAPYAHPYYWAPFFLMGNWL